MPTKAVAYLLSFDASDAKRPFGLKSIRGGQIHAWIDANGKPIAHGSNADRSTGSLMSQRTLDLLLDPAQHWSDSKAKQLGSFYGSFNILLRQSATQTSRLHQMTLLKTLMKRDVFLPEWLQDVFLGYGNPQSVNPGSLTNFPHKLDMRDTFVDAKHVQESFPELVSSAPLSISL